jgi:hypothetical protein
MARRSHPFALQLFRLLHPGGELNFIEPVVLADVEIAHFFLLDSPGGTARSDVPLLFPEDMDTADAWQFKNVIVR